MATKRAGDLNKGDRIMGAWSGGKVCIVQGVTIMVSMVLEDVENPQLNKIRMQADDDVMLAPE